MKSESQEPVGEFCQYRNDRYYKIENYDRMSTFFMSIVSAYDHWLFLASNGGLTAGRQNSEKSLFPYYSEDKIVDMAHCTGPICMVRENGSFWQVFNPNTLDNADSKHTVLKSTLGDRIFFKEQKHSISVEYGWSFSEQFGLVKTTRVTNESSEVRELDVLDGVQNVLPANIDPDNQHTLSVLIDAYKSVDIVNDNLAVYYLSSRLSDLAEPSESLYANTIWHCVTEGNVKLNVSASPAAPKQFANQQPINNDKRLRGVRGSYFLETSVSLAPGEFVEWQTVCEVSLNAIAIQDLTKVIASKSISALVAEDIQVGITELKNHLAKADGIQVSGTEETSVHHGANTLFNIMRGGLFEDSYEIDVQNLKTFVSTRNFTTASDPFWKALPKKLTVSELSDKLIGIESTDLKRLVREYLPISFSRRHGDPSRPWNRFSINLKDENGDAIKGYQGNWRDIFQNWEPLAYSYPEFLPGMISSFLNATTADGYNPFRVTSAGIEWEEPEPGNPWANIGYWSDHQIIYLSKLLELQNKIKPGQLKNWFEEKSFSYANVPYRIKEIEALKKDPHNSIDFDYDLNKKISRLTREIGSDAKLILNDKNQVVHGNLMEKLLTLWLAKLSNFVPGGGIWMNTQRPEWNDANNALVGWGLSIVTLAYLHRHLAFMKTVIDEQTGVVEVSMEIGDWFSSVKDIFAGNIDATDTVSRMQSIDALALSADKYRRGLYHSGLNGECRSLTYQSISEFLDSVLPSLSKSLKANKRDDNLYHSYNLLQLSDAGAAVNHLPGMLEGQVAILSSGVLTSEESLTLLTSLRNSELYREDQHTYLLYPNKQLPAFLQKNVINSKLFEKTVGAGELLKSSNVFEKGSDGSLHFNSNYKNARDLQAALSCEGIEGDAQLPVLNLYESTFNHNAFTGRSGSFFGYEGLGSTYWHMVSKLLLATLENWVIANASGADQSILSGLKTCYYDIRSGIGFNKSPEQYGAFPTDPYSHTPETGIARQPGMTGQVKEELITRLGELGLQWANESIDVLKGLLNEDEFLIKPNHFNYLDLANSWQTLDLPVGTLAFCVAQVPFIYRKVSNTKLKITIQFYNGETQVLSGNRLPKEVFKSICERNNTVRLIEVDYPVDTDGTIA